MKRAHSLLMVMIAMALTALFVTGALSLSFFSRFLDRFQKYVVNQEKAKAEVAIGMLDKDVETMRKMMYRTVTAEELNRIKLQYTNRSLNSDYLESVQKVQGQISTMQLVLKLAKSISIYLPDNQLVISVGSASGYNQLDTHTMALLDEHPGSSLIMDDDKLLFVVRSDVGRGEYSVNAVMTNSVAKYVIRTYLAQFISDEENTRYALFVSDGERRDFFTSTGNRLSEEGEACLETLLAQSESGRQVFEENGELFLVTWEKSAVFPLQICQITPMHFLEKEVHEYRIMAIVCILGALVLVGIMSGVICLMFKRPLQKMKTAISQVGKGDFSTRIEPTWSIEFQQIFDHFNQMTHRVQQLIQNEYKLKLLNVKAELKQMQYQISPHFLYNTYFILRAMLLDEEYDSAEQMAQLLGSYLQYITKDGRDYATLESEVRHGMNYLQIQKIRFGSRIETQCEECPDCLRELRVPKLIVQPLIENAFEHGIRNQVEKGIIRVRFIWQDNALRIRVEDNGANTPDEVIEHMQDVLSQTDGSASDSGVALVNISKRLKMIYGEEGQLNVSRSELGGFCSEIYLGGIVTDEQSPDRR